VTQIISAITDNFTLLAADRQLTIVEGPQRGAIIEDNECKLVSLCHTSGIGYTGPARLEGRRTHEWIAVTLAAASASDPDTASRVLANAAQKAVAPLSAIMRRLTFMFAGWACVDSQSHVRPYFCVVSITLDSAGHPLSTTNENFSRYLMALRPGADVAVQAVGEVLPEARRSTLKRNLRELLHPDVSIWEAVRSWCQKLQTPTNTAEVR
jgi:hypothetical protein